MKSLLAISLFLLSLSVFAFSADVPDLTGPVVDSEKLLTPQVVQELGVALEGFYQKSGVQLQVLTVPSFDGLDTAAYSLAVVDKWKLGKKGDDRAILLLVSKGERRARIEVGTGLEGDLPDLVAGRIVDKMIVFFRHQDYQEGILFATSMIGQRIGVPIQLNEHERKVRNRKRQSGAGSLLFIIIMLTFFGRSFFPLALISMGSGQRMRSINSWGGGRSSGGWGGGGSSGGWGGGGSSGGWSGGGGGFSGGGASGNW